MRPDASCCWMFTIQRDEYDAEGLEFGNVMLRPRKVARPSEDPLAGESPAGKGLDNVEYGVSMPSRLDTIGVVWLKPIWFSPEFDSAAVAPLGKKKIPP